MKYAIIVPFNYRKVKFDTIKSATENTKPLLYYQLDLLVNKLGFDKVFIIHKHENVSGIVREIFSDNYEFVHPLDLEYSEDQEENYYLKSLAIAISRIPDSTKELCIIGDNLLIDPIINFELMTYGNKHKYISYIESNFSRGLYDSAFESSVFENSDLINIPILLSSYNNIGYGRLLPMFNLKGSALEFLRLEFSDNYGLNLLYNLSSLSESRDFKVYSISNDDFREFYTFDDINKFRIEMESKE